ncbi:MAG: hypothetical protein QM831_33850 [Kofleriaceae bacterium]
MKKHLFAILLVAACGKGDKAADSKGGGGAPAVAIDAAAVNALVPADLKDKLVFEKQDFHEKHGHHDITYTVAAPKDWKPRMEGMMNLHGPDAVGFMTSMDLGSNCDGSCEPKDWAAVSDKVNFAQFTKDGWKVTKDDKQANGRLLIAEKDDSTYVTYAWWQKGDKRYYTCTVSLDKPVKTAGEAFAKACQAVNVTGE